MLNLVSAARVTTNVDTFIYTTGTGNGKHRGPPYALKIISLFVSMGICIHNWMQTRRVWEMLDNALIWQCSKACHSMWEYAVQQLLHEGLSHVCVLKPLQDAAQLPQVHTR
jgi:hypothetical protein